MLKMINPKKLRCRTYEGDQEILVAIGERPGKWCKVNGLEAEDISFAVLSVTEKESGS